MKVLRSECVCVCVSASQADCRRNPAAVNEITSIIRAALLPLNTCSLFITQRSFRSFMKSSVKTQLRSGARSPASDRSLWPHVSTGVCGVLFYFSLYDLIFILHHWQRARSSFFCYVSENIRESSISITQIYKYERFCSTSIYGHKDTPT